MKMKTLSKSIIFVFFIILSSAAPAKEKLQFKFDINDVYIIEKFQNVTIFVGTRKILKQEKNRIVLTVTNVYKDGVQMQGQFITYSRFPGKSSHYQLESQYKSNFKLFFNGKYAVAANSWMPNVRNIPMLSDKPIKNNDTWKAPAAHVIKWNKRLIHIPIQVFYQAKKMEHPPKLAHLHPFFAKYKSTKAQHVEFKYKFHKRVQDQKLYAIQGKSLNQLWFDSKSGIPIFSHNTIIYVFLHHKNQTNVRYHFQVFTWYQKIHKIKKNKKQEMIADAKRKLKKGGGVTVKSEKNGIKLTLNNILFKSGSANLTPRAKADLRRIAKILQQYPNREIRVLGHTDNVGPLPLHWSLSKERAQSVVSELKKNGIDPTRLSYKGYGSTKPVASNKTSKGRALNRRVEIMVITE